MGTIESLNIDLTARTASFDSAIGKSKEGLAGFGRAFKTEASAIELLSKRIFNATHSAFELDMNRMTNTFSQLREKWKDNEKMLTLITRTESAERLRINEQYGKGSWLAGGMTGRGLKGLGHLAGGVTMLGGGTEGDFGKYLTLGMGALHVTHAIGDSFERGGYKAAFLTGGLTAAAVVAAELLSTAMKISKEMEEWGKDIREESKVWANISKKEIPTTAKGSQFEKQQEHLKEELQKAQDRLNAHESKPLHEQWLVPGEYVDGLQNIISNNQKLIPVLDRRITQERELYEQLKLQGELPQQKDLVSSKISDMERIVSLLKDGSMQNKFDWDMKALSKEFGSDIPKDAIMSQSDDKRNESLGKSIFDETRTPLEKFKKSVDDASIQRHRGTIDEDTYIRRVKQLSDTYDKSQGGVGQFTTLANSRMDIAGLTLGQQNQDSKQQLQEQRKSNAWLDKIASKLGLAP